MINEIDGKIEWAELVANPYTADGIFSKNMWNAAVESKLMDGKLVLVSNNYPIARLNHIDMDIHNAMTCMNSTIFMLTTGSPEIYLKQHFTILPENVWFGIEIKNHDEIMAAAPVIEKLSGCRNVFLSLDPLESPLEADSLIPISKAQWLIIGPTTQHTQTIDMLTVMDVEYVVNHCLKQKTPIFLRNSCPSHLRYYDLSLYPLLQQLPPRRTQCG